MTVPQSACSREICETSHVADLGFLDAHVENKSGKVLLLVDTHGMAFILSQAHLAEQAF
jgi:hypothetical protein